MEIKIEIPQKEITGLSYLFEEDTRRENEYVIFPRFKLFSSLDDLIKDITVRVSEITQRAVKNLLVDEDITIVLENFDDPLVNASYNDEKITVSLHDILHSLYSRHNRDNPFTNYSKAEMQRVIEHEIRHSLDKEFSKKYEELTSLLSIDYSRAPLDFYLFKLLLEARVEGFASFDKTLNREIYTAEDYLKELKCNTQTVNTWLKHLRDREPLNLVDGFDLETSTLSKGVAPGSKKKLKYWTYISPYIQGPHLMNLIAFGKIGKIVRNISLGAYKDTLSEVREISLMDFYNLFYQSLGELNLDHQFSIYPRRKSLQTIQKYSSNN